MFSMLLAYNAIFVVGGPILIAAFGTKMAATTGDRTIFLIWLFCVASCVLGVVLLAIGRPTAAFILVVISAIVFSVGLPIVVSI